jgi:hypothetical protein
MSDNTNTTDTTVSTHTPDTSESVATLSLSPADQDKLVGARKDLQIARLTYDNAQANFRLFVLNLYRVYGLGDNDTIDENGVITKK